MSRSLDEVDTKVGAAVRAWRLARGVSPVELARRVGLSDQQVQKFERGHNRIMAGRLQAIVPAMEVAPGAFFAEPFHDGPDAGQAKPGQQDTAALTLALPYVRTAEPDLRRGLFEIARCMQRAGGKGGGTT